MESKQELGGKVTVQILPLKTNRRWHMSRYLNVTLEEKFEIFLYVEIDPIQNNYNNNSKMPEIKRNLINQQFFFYCFSIKL